jgi:hypothetical protein
MKGFYDNFGVFRSILWVFAIILGLLSYIVSPKLGMNYKWIINELGIILYKSWWINIELGNK